MKNLKRTLALSLALAMVASTATSALAAEHVVVSGDNLSKIAAQYGTTWQTLAEINSLANPNLIYPGDVIQLPTTEAEVEVEVVVPEIVVVPEVEVEVEVVPEEEAPAEEGPVMAPIPDEVEWELSVEEGNAIEEELLAAVGYSAAVGGYPIVDTNQTVFYSNDAIIDEPAVGEAFYGQDAQFTGNAPSYTDNGDGTISDNVTGLMWQQDPGVKMNFLEAVENLDAFNEAALGGYSDWRIPTIKELYSLIDFSGGTGVAPYINTDYFVFSYGDESIGERVIDSQMVSTTIYGDVTMNRNTTLFGTNFADGRIKGYGVQMDYYCYYVRGNTNYGMNLFVDNGDETITDQATSLMWMQNDSGYLSAGDYGDGTMSWEDALAWAQEMNEIEYLGYSDWRLPNVKELQSLVDYTRSPTVTNSAAIDELFYCTPIVNLFGVDDYAFYWSSTTHNDQSASDVEYGAASYVIFGEAMGVMDGEIMDVHGAGAQRSDPKTGDSDEYPRSDPMAPQGDEQRVFNMVRLVRDWDDAVEVEVEVEVEVAAPDYMVSQIEDAVAYEPPGHYDVTPLRLHSDSDLGGYMTAGLSTFEIGGYADMSVSTVEMLYYIVEGEMTVTMDDGEVYVLQTGDSIHFGVGVGRSPVNTYDGQTKMLVVSCPGIEGATEGLYKVVYAEDAVEYEAVGHYDVTPTRLHNPDDVEGALMVGLSHFDATGGADMADAPAEMIYFIINGEMTITTGDGESHVLQNDDSIRFMTGTGREPVNTYGDVTQMLVISCSLAD